MPTRSRPTTGPLLTRRAALASLVGATAAACTPQRGVDRRDRETEPERTEPAVDPDVAVAMAALAAQTAFIDLARRTRDRHPSLTGLLTPVLAAHEAHAALLADASPEQAASPAGPEARRARVPRQPARAVRRLVVAEEQLTTATKQHAFKARSGAFARVLGSMAAAAAQNAAVLGSAARGGRTS